MPNLDDITEPLQRSVLRSILSRLRRFILADIRARRMALNRRVIADFWSLEEIFAREG